MTTSPEPTPLFLSPRLRLALLAATAVVAVSVAVWRTDRSVPSPIARSATTGEVFTIAFTGDTVVTSVLPDTDSDKGFGHVAALIQQASVAITNVEQTFAEHAPADRRRPTTWPVGGRLEAAELARLGFDVVTRANNRAVPDGAADDGESGRVLELAGLAHVGVGADLARARAPLAIGGPPHPLAIMAVAISSAPASRATPSREEIKGRAGVNPLRFTAEITVDAATFEGLKASAPALQPESESTDTAMTLFGRSIVKGERTQITFGIDREDEAAILAQIEAARQAGHVVVVALHSHEPSNHSEVPAEFVRQFAHAAIDRGASLVVGHGPHQLRGIEARGGGLIIYSLGNFLFPFEPLASRDADLFDAGTDLYALALGAIDGPAARTPSPIDAPAWWEGLVAVARFERGVLQSVRLHPIDLGVELAPERRGTPRGGIPSVNRRILERLRALSAAFGTPIRIDGEQGAIDFARPQETSK